MRFSEDSKGEDGGSKVKRRSERLKKKTPSAEKFVRKLRPTKEMTWGPYRSIIPEEGEDAGMRRKWSLRRKGTRRMERVQAKQEECGQLNVATSQGKNSCKYADLNKQKNARLQCNKFKKFRCYEIMTQPG